MAATVTMDRGWGLLLRDLEIDSRDVARRAGLPADLLARESCRLAVPDFFRLIEAIEAEANEPELPIRAGQSASPEGFSPPIFAALCSSTLSVAVQRIATHKPLVAPMACRNYHPAKPHAWVLPGRRPGAGTAAARGMPVCGSTGSRRLRRCLPSWTRRVPSRRPAYGPPAVPRTG